MSGKISKLGTADFSSEEIFSLLDQLIHVMGGILWNTGKRKKIRSRRSGGQVRREWGTSSLT